ncbi:MAG TPA: glycosyltransferase family 2 protein [Thermoanaerobaculia bacterium]|nr:glycosyltransferase family 2 protein [Thermoanaerobaculia bacterium]
MPPLVSIIVPSYNQGRFIRETVDSILTQDYRPIEVLVLDGASKDETVDVLRSYGELPELRWWSEPDKGVVDAVNKGLARASGEILAIQSSDDTYLPGAITAAVNAFAGEALIYGDVEYIDSQSRTFDRTNLGPFDLAEYAGKLTFIPQPAAFFTKAAADAAGPWRADISYAADAEFYLRIATRGRVRKIDQLLARYRYHDDQRDRAGGKIARDWEAAITSWIEREQPAAAVRRRARAGIHLTRAHYLPDAQWPQRTLELYRAALSEPSILTRPEFPRRELIPARTPIWRVLSRIKRVLGLKPR